MSKEKTKENVIKHKKAAIRKLNAQLEGFIAMEDEAHLKKTDLISYWLESFSDYINWEESFDPNRLINYSRGDIIQVNFGFNIGKELGGLHYAVVLDNDSKRSSDVITVIPLSSTDGRQIHPRSVNLGTELYEKVMSVQNKLLNDTATQIEETKKLQTVLNSSIILLKHSLQETGLSEELTKKYEEVTYLKNEVDTRLTEFDKRMAIIARNQAEIEKMKLGSMAVTNQVTTISKQRIYKPKRSTDFLYGISLSASAMDKINEKLKELYFF